MLLPRPQRRTLLQRRVVRANPLHPEGASAAPAHPAPAHANPSDHMHAPLRSSVSTGFLAQWAGHSPHPIQEQQSTLGQTLLPSAEWLPCSSLDDLCLPCPVSDTTMLKPVRPKAHVSTQSPRHLEPGSPGGGMRSLPCTYTHNQGILTGQGAGEGRAASVTTAGGASRGSRGPSASTPVDTSNAASTA